MKKIVSLLMSVLLLAGCAAPEIRPPEENMQAAVPGTSSGTVSSSVSSEPASEPSSEEVLPPEEIYTGIFAEYMPRAEEIAAEMTVNRKLGQIILSATFAGGNDPVGLTERDQPGGYVLFKHDFEGLNADQVREKLAAMQAVSEIPMIMAVDEEGGEVVRISSNPQLRGERFPSQAKTYAGGSDFIRESFTERAELLLDLGCNVMLAPVADVSTDKNDYIHGRTVGLPAAETADFISQAVTAAEEAGCGTALKHFPGYGNNLNTHTDVSIDERMYETFVESDFVPFKAGFDAGCSAVMVSHNIVISMDADLPASLSPEVNRIIREELGFTGLIMTDDMGMDAIGLHTGDEEPVVLAVQSGADLLLSQDFAGTHALLTEAYEAGAITPERLDEAVVNVLCWKMHLGILE